MRKNKNTRQVPTRPTKKQALGDHGYCAQHECPQIEIGGQVICLLDYVARQIYRCRIRDLVPGAHDSPAMLVFDNGRSMSWLCPICQEPLPMPDAEQTLQMLNGLYVYNLVWLLPQESFPEGALMLLLSRSVNELVGEQVFVTHWRSVYDLQ